MTSDNSHNISQIKISFGYETQEMSYKQKSAITVVKFECYFKLLWLLSLLVQNEPQLTYFICNNSPIFTNRV